MMPSNVKNVDGGNETTPATSTTSRHCGKHATVHRCNVQAYCARVLCTVQWVLYNSGRQKGRIVLVDYTLVTHYETDDRVSHSVTDFSNGAVVSMEETRTIIHDGSTRYSSKPPITNTNST